MSLQKNQPLVFWIESYAELGQRIATALDAETGHIDSKPFADGEGYLRIRTDVRERNVILVGGTWNDRALLDVFDIGCAVAAYGARSLKIVVPYYGHSTMERMIHPGEIVKAKTRARILSAIPVAPFGNQVILLDLHTDGIPFYFEGQVKTRHLYARSIILREALRLGGDHLVLGSVDAGRAKWVESLANELGVQAGFVYKRRDSAGQVSIAGINVSVAGKNVVIYDDMIRSGGSLIQAARAYKEAGANQVAAITTHGIFTDGALDKLKSCGLFTEIVATDSHPSSLKQKGNSLTVISVAEVFAHALKD